ncbi:hypothetical protein [Saccharothrix xinjiangensis]|uniref:Uncharacterized protein n=1 Tax=Saccharothrix xinjiangensis TaxID=204798 RepID=A0ABV9XYT9_9PSEU
MVVHDGINISHNEDRGTGDAGTGKTGDEAASGSGPYPRSDGSPTGGFAAILGDRLKFRHLMALLIFTVIVLTVCLPGMSSVRVRRRGDTR